MQPDIRIIIEKVKQQFPEVSVYQWKKIHPADDDGLWWFGLPGVEEDIQVESSRGNCPFILETNDFSSAAAKTAVTADEAVAIITA